MDIWTVVCGRVVPASEFGGSYMEPTLTGLKQTLEEMGCDRFEPVRDFAIDFVCSEDEWDFWHGESGVNFAEVQNYDYPDFRQALVKALGHGYPVYLCLSRGPDPEREHLSTFASFLLAHQQRLYRPLGAQWSATWELTNSAMTRITYGEVRKLYVTLKETKLLYF